MQRPRGEEEWRVSEVWGDERSERGGQERRARAAQAAGKHLAVESHFPPCLLQITLFILSFDVSVEPSLGTGQEARIERINK